MNPLNPLNPLNIFKPYVGYAVTKGGDLGIPNFRERSFELLAFNTQNWRSNQLELLPGILYT